MAEVLEGTEGAVLELHPVPLALPLRITGKVLLASIEHQVIEIDFQTAPGVLLVEDAEAVELRAVFPMARQKRRGVDPAIDFEGDLSLTPLSPGVVAQPERMDGAIGEERLGGGGLIPALEGRPAAGPPVLGAVFEEHPVLSPVPVDAESQRVGRAPAARAVMEPADERSARAIRFRDCEIARDREPVFERAHRNALRVPGRPQGALNPSTHFARPSSRQRGGPVAEVLPHPVRRRGNPSIQEPLPAGIGGEVLLPRRGRRTGGEDQERERGVQRTSGDHFSWLTV